MVLVRVVRAAGVADPVVPVARAVPEGAAGSRGASRGAKVTRVIYSKKDF